MKQFLLLLMFLICACRLLAVEDPNLSSVEYLSQSDEYRVWVDGQELFVYKSSKNGSHNTNGINSMSFVNFDLTAPVAIEVLPSATVSSYEIRPYSENIAGTLEGNTISFALNQPKKLVIRLNNSYDKVLVLCANPPHTPPDPASVEYYYGPGVHQIGYRMPLGSNADVYIAEGAVVEGSFDVSGSNITISGRGVLACGQWPHQEDFSVIRGRNTSNVLLEGITICNAPGWIISFWNGSNGLTVRNLKQIGNWLYNTDGVQTGTNGLLVEDCFLQCNDDNFSLNGTCTSVEIRNNVFWNIYNGGLFMLGWGITNLSDFNIHDNVIFRHGGCCSHHRKGPFSMKLENSGAVVQNISFSNIIVEELIQYGQWVNFQMEASGTVRDIYFNNIQILNMTWGPEGLLDGYSADYPIEDVYFNQVRINGQLIENAQQGGLILNNTSRIFFEDSYCSGSLSAEWTSTRIGTAAPVCASEDAGLFTVEGTGVGLGGFSDGFHLVHQQAGGDADIIARVGPFTNAVPGAKAGVMIREDTAPDAPYAMVCKRVTDNAVLFGYRLVPGGPLMGSVGPICLNPWVRLVRTGNQYTGFLSQYSQEGPWEQIGPAQEIDMEPAAAAGLFVSSQDSNTITAVLFNCVRVRSGTGEILENPAYEDGLNPWSEYNGSICDIQTVSDPVHGGNSAAQVYNRTNRYTGIQQNITADLLANGPGEYSYSAWVRTQTGTLPLYAIVKIADASGNHYFSASNVTADSTSWKQSKITANLTWNNLTSAFFYIETNSTDLYSFYVDDCSLSKGELVPGLPPGPVGGFTALGAHEKIEMGWSAPADPGGSPITSYRVYRAEGAAGPLLYLDEVPAETLFYTDPNVLNGQEYSYAAAAVNAGGIGALSPRAILTAEWNSYDLDKNGFIGLAELYMICGGWMWQGTPGGHVYDFSGDGSVNLEDMAAMARQWLWKAAWFQE